MPAANLAPVLPQAAIPWFAVAPFAAMLLAIAVLPLTAHVWWDNNRHRLLVSALLGTPVVLWLGATRSHFLLHTAWEYAAFIILLSSLYVTTGGIVLRGSMRATAAHNTLLLCVGGLLASLIGTTGASMLLIRPLLRANAGRRRCGHVVLFFIFIVSNVGGLLTPLGDPPLFLGFLRGVPFSWTLRLWPQWAWVNGALLLWAYATDRWFFVTDGAPPPSRNSPHTELHIAGAPNIVYLLAVIGIIFAAGRWHLPPGVQEVGMLLITVLAYTTTPEALRRENDFSFGPIVEVAVVFAGIFATMGPALLLLGEHGAALGVEAPWQFFWLTGLLSSFLDNAPTYLTFSAAASALVGTDPSALGELLATPRGDALLRAIACGAVMMGANTYLGNGPNFMVKALAERADVRMPSFFGYAAISTAVLMPLFVAVTFLFFAP